MAATDRITLKSWFEAGDKPTEAQFASLIDSFLNLVDDTSYTDRILQKLKIKNKTADFQSNFTANQRLFAIDFKVNSGSITLKVGTSSGADDIIWEQTITQNTCFDVPNYFENIFTLWFAISGGGNCDINILTLDNYY